MSDVSVGSVPSAPAAAPAAASMYNVSPPNTAGRTDIPVQVNPVQIPNPVPSQGVRRQDPGEVKGSQLHPQSRMEARREAIQKAFGKQSEVETERQRPRTITKTDNHPPEELPTERAKERPPKERLDLKKRPDDQPPDRRPGSSLGTPGQAPPRGDHGHFASRQAPQPLPGQQRQPGQPRGQAAPSSTAPQHGYPAAYPVRGMSQAAAQHWANTPEPVRLDMHRLHNEFGRALASYQADRELMNQIRHY